MTPDCPLPVEMSTGKSDAIPNLPNLATGRPRMRIERPQEDCKRLPELSRKSVNVRRRLATYGGNQLKLSFLRL